MSGAFCMKLSPNTTLNVSLTCIYTDLSNLIKPQNVFSMLPSPKSVGVCVLGVGGGGAFL